MEKSQLQILLTSTVDMAAMSFAVTSLAFGFLCNFMDQFLLEAFVYTSRNSRAE